MTKINFTGEVNTSEINASYFEDQLKNVVNQQGGNIDIHITTEEDITQLKQRIEEIVKYNFLPDEDGAIEIYVPYDDKLSNPTIEKIMKAPNPRVAFSETIASFDTWYEWNNLFDIVNQNLEDDEKELYINNKMEINDWLFETYSFYYPENHYNKSVKVNIMLDTGNMNYDFTCDNVLNWYGQGCRNEFDENSSMLWLAKQQRKVGLLKGCVKKNIANEDKFVKSAIQELKNHISSMGTMTFLVEMSLFDLFEIHEAIAKEKEFNKSYYLDERKGTGYIVLDKSTMCGLFNTWSGGGSLLGIECEKDIKIPIKCIFDAVVDGTKIYGYDVDEVYGLVGSCWKPTLKEIHPMETEVM